MKKQGVSIRIHPAGAAALAASVLFLDSRQVLSSFLALVLHEGAHLLAMRLCGICVCTVELTPFGGMADARSFECQPPGKRALCAFAGVAGSALTAVFCLEWAPRTVFWRLFFQANLMLAAVNSLPAWPLDGARIIAAVAGKAGFEAAARKALSCFTMVLGVGFVVLGLYGIWQGMLNLSLLATGPYLWYAARTEEVSSRVRRLQAVGKKLSGGGLVPAIVWAGSIGKDEMHFGRLLGRMRQDQYHFFLQVDPKNGCVHKVWSEDEMLIRAMEDCQK